MLEERTTTARPDYASMSLEELAASANENARKAEDAERAAIQILFEGVRSAMDSGDALILIQRSVGDGQWKTWVAENFKFGRGCAARYMRLAEHRDHVEEWILGGGTEGRGSIEAAIEAISGLPSRPKGAAKHSPELKERAKHLHRGGVRSLEIAKLLNTSHGNVKYWIDPAYRRREIEKSKHYARQKREADRALKEKREREEKARLAASPSDVGKAYGHVRQLTDALSRAITAVESPDVRRHLREAERLALKSEEAIWRAYQEMQAND